MTTTEAVTEGTEAAGGAAAEAGGPPAGRRPRRPRAAAAPKEPKPAKAPTVATPWGPAAVVAQASVPQRAGERRFHSSVQLLADERGEPLVRFAYATAGVARRGPVTLRARDLERLRAAAQGQPALAALLGWDGGAPSAPGGEAA